MKSIFELLDSNKKEAIKILRSKENNTIKFAQWDDELEEYVPTDDNCYTCDVCPWVRLEVGEEGIVEPQMVIEVRYNEEKKCVEIITTKDQSEKSDGKYFNVTWCDDISYWSVFDYIGKYE